MPNEEAGLTPTAFDSIRPHCPEGLMFPVRNLPRKTKHRNEKTKNRKQSFDFGLTHVKPITKLKATLDEATDPWGVKVERVEVKDVRLPVQLQRAMAAEAEAARDARARVCKSFHRDIPS